MVDNFGGQNYNIFKSGSHFPILHKTVLGAHAHAHLTCTCIHIHAHSHAHKHRHMQAHTHMQTHIHVHTHTHTHVHTCRHIHTLCIHMHAYTIWLNIKVLRQIIYNYNIQTKLYFCIKQYNALMLNIFLTIPSPI